MSNEHQRMQTGQVQDKERTSSKQNVAVWDCKSANFVNLQH